MDGDYSVRPFNTVLEEGSRSKTIRYGCIMVTSVFPAFRLGSDTVAGISS
jgi:hypothetical protein